MQKKIFITGATGFVGSWLVRRLTEDGEDVSILVRNKKLNARLQSVSTKIKIYEGDLQSDSLEKIVDSIKPTIVFHLAANGALPSQSLTTVDAIDTNLKGVMRLINAVKKHDIKLFINTGSSSEYGIKNAPMLETDVLVPINDYGFSKAAATLYCQKVALTESLPIITLRLFSPYGYQDDPKRLVSFVINKALNNEPISLSSKTNVRDFIFIEDVISAYMQTLEMNIKPGEIVNIGSGEQHRTYDIVKHIIALTNSKSNLLWGEMPVQSRQIEPKIWKADISKAKEILHWQPKFTIEEGLEKTIRQYKQAHYE